MSRFSDPIKSIKDISFVICISGFVLLAFHNWAAPQPELAGLDFLGWLAVPALFVVLYLTLGRGWRFAGIVPALRGQARWYLFALTLPPILAGILLLVNHMTGLVELTSSGLEYGLTVGLSGLATLFIKNIVEELIFRGFFTGYFSKTSLAGIKGHVLTGLIWSTWHLVYWFALLPEGKIEEVSGLSAPSFVIVGYVALTLHAILFGELRLITGSILVGVILHTVNNVLLIGLVAAAAVPKGTLTAMILTPVDFGLLYAGALAFIGVLIWKKRIV